MPQMCGWSECIREYKPTNARYGITIAYLAFLAEQVVTLRTQLEPLNLPSSCLRQFGDELDPTRAFVGGHVLPAVFDQLARQFVRWRVAFLQAHKRLGFDQIRVVGLADDGALQHRRVADQRALDLDRRDPDAADLQHVVRAARVPVVAILVHEI